MARYRKIDVRIWGDSRFRKLSAPPPNAQSLWVYLLTGPHTTNIPGLSCAGEAALAEALGWSLPDFREAFREVAAQGMAKADWQARVVWVPRAIRYNQPESPNVVRSWRATWDEIPECELKAEARMLLRAEIPKGEAFVKAFEEALPEAFEEALPEALPEAFEEALPEGVLPPGDIHFSDPSPNQEQEQEQEPEPEEESPEPQAASGPAPCPAQQGPEEKTQQDDSPAVFVFPTVGNGAKEWALTEAKVSEYRESFPGVDVLAECRAALQWCRDNPTKRKTPRGMPAFLSRWLTKAQDRGRPAGATIPSGPAARPPMSDEERTRRVLADRAERQAKYGFPVSPSGVNGTTGGTR